MNLKEYLFYESISVNEFAKIADLSASYLSQIINDRVKPSPKTCRSIERVTNGKVRAYEVNEQVTGSKVFA